MVQDLEAAETEAGVSKALVGFDEDAILDVPLMYVQGRDRIRVMVTAANQLTTRRMEPQVVRLKTVGGRLHMEVDTIIHWRVTRHWWLPLTYMFPDADVHCTFSIVVKPWTQKISSVKARLHNIPVFLPFLVRYTTGWVGGSVGVVAEPYIHKSLEFLTSSVTDTLSAQPVQAVTQSETMQRVTGAAGSLAGQAQGLVTKLVDKVA